MLYSEYGFQSSQGINSAFDGDFAKKHEAGKRQNYLYLYFQGRLHKGGMVRDAPWRKLGGECCDDKDAFARVYNNLLLHEYIYYFTPVHF